MLPSRAYRAGAKDEEEHRLCSVVAGLLSECPRCALPSTLSRNAVASNAEAALL